MSLVVLPCAEAQISVTSATNGETTSHSVNDEETASQAYTETTVYDPLHLELRWDGLSDPDNPRNWPWSIRAVNASIISSVGLVSSFASSILVPAVPDVMHQFGVTDPVVGALTTSLYVLGLGFGPFLLAPLSELYGRRIVYNSTLTTFTLLQMGSALSRSMSLLVVLRFLAGLAGGMAPSLGQASMSDLWDMQDRGRWAAVLTLGPMLGPPVGNFVASLVLSKHHWVWIFWILTVFSGTLLLLVIFVLRETYEPVILRKRRQRRLRHVQADRGVVQKKYAGLTNGQLSDKFPVTDPSNIFGRAITRPLRFLVTSPILIIFGFFLAYTYGLFYLLLTSLPLLFGREQNHTGLFNYKFNKIGTGLSYLGLAIGFLLGCLSAIYAQTRIWNFFAKRNGDSRPEYRLLPMTIGMLLLPISLLWYGWSAERQDHWMIPQIATVLFGIGMFVTFQSIQVYLMEAFIPYSASAIAAATLMRSITGAVFPLFGQEMFMHLGYGKGGTLLAMLALPAIPLPWILYKNGSQLRERWPFSP